MKKLFLISIAIIIGFSSCNKEDSCNNLIVLDEALYDTVSTQNYTILNAAIINDCIEVEIYSGGCDGSTWEVTMVDAGIIAESLPIQRFIKISLKNEEVCLAMITKTYSFDLRPVRTSNESQISLNLANWDKSLLYNYQ